MFKTTKGKIGTILVMVLMLTFVLSNAVYAAVVQNGSDVKFTKHLIDSNSYTKVATGTKINAGKTLYATVTHMYDSDGTAQDLWEKSKWRVYDGDGDIIADNVTLTKGEYTGISLSTKVTNEDAITVKARGNVLLLDARISGYLHNFTKK